MMKQAFYILAALVFGIAVGVVVTRTDWGSAAKTAGETGDAVETDANVGHAHAPGEGHDEESSKPMPISDWCVEHRVPESACTKCNPSLVGGFKAKNDWCVEHGLPESHCRLCNPGIEFPQEAAIRAMQPKLDLGVSVFFPGNQPLCATDGAIIQFASAETFTRSGLSIEPVIAASGLHEIEAPAELVFDQQAAANLTLPIRASVVLWLVEPGQTVREGQVLAICESPEAARLKGDYLEACADAERHEKDQLRQDELFARNLIDAASYELAKADAQGAIAHRRKAEGELRALGLNDDDLAEVREGKLSARFALRAPASGTVVERTAPLGVALEEGTHLALVADPSSLWIEARVREFDLPQIEDGQTAVFTADGAALQRVESRVIWVSQFLDPATRTGIVRARPIGDVSALRAHQFGHLDFIEQSSESALLVPRDAVQWEGCCHVVFVRETQDRYRPRKVAIAKGDSEHYRVLSGVNPGDWVVVNGSFLLKTELKKSSIGAGCCGLEAKS